MNPLIAEFVGPIVGVSIVISGFLIGMRMWLHRPVRGKGLPGEDAAQLLESMEVLQEQVQQLRGDMVDLHERVDFAERLLTKGEKKGE